VREGAGVGGVECRMLYEWFGEDVYGPLFTKSLGGCEGDPYHYSGVIPNEERVVQILGRSLARQAILPALRR
jgi:hypothetical protein